MVSPDVIDLSRLWVAEWVVCAFFAYLVAVSRILALGGRSRVRVLTTGLVCVGAVVMLSQLRPSPALQIVREWLPAVYLLQAYWLCGLFFRRPMLGVERRLLDADRALFRLMNLTTLLTHGPRVVLEYFEFTYLMVYPLVPASFALFLFVGGRPDTDSFWTAILVAGYGCYGVLPWIQTRPPRSIERTSHEALAGLLVRRLNLFVLHKGSVQVNTFPSGHAAVAIAAALAVSTVHAGAGGAFLILAISITIATVLGRYHYAVDSLLGVLVGVVGWWIGFRGLAV